ncbi:hypothetical protein GPECTOR_61g867 [Gonium pectorale]|uniref:BAR domain-containing protein n=1 Tax=Gonium pectorale TaxID=33097 RepID=A0A150G514_GONPE|nr:hypothetical protein GPECTOR_61g867 [Gonium pectorale]|eukprot:KXZ44914.1 hypothetical protein GPECTOR_61g867 [Gonium pectorale]
MWAKFKAALGMSEGGGGGPSTPGRRRSTEGGGPSLLDRHDRSLEEMHDFEKDLTRFTKHVRDYKAATEAFLSGASAFLLETQLPRLYDNVALGPTGATATAAAATTTAGEPGGGESPGGGAAATAPSSPQPTAAAPASELAVVEPPPPAAHGHLYGTDHSAALLQRLAAGAAERFEDLLLAAGVWLGTYEDAKLSGPPAKVAATQPPLEAGGAAEEMQPEPPQRAAEPQPERPAAAAATAVEGVAGGGEAPADVTAGGGGGGEGAVHGGTAGA